jgi:hypothetical protein
MKGPAPRPWQDRLWEKAEPDANGCWLWKARSVDSEGYAIFRGYARPGHSPISFAHRWAYIARHGSIPEGMEIDHLCNVRHCINPDHLEPVTGAENSRRAAERRRLKRLTEERAA